MTDAVDERLRKGVFEALTAGRDAGAPLLKKLPAGAQVPASYALTLVIDTIRAHMLTLLAGSGRVDVEGDVPVDVTVGD